MDRAHEVHTCCICKKEFIGWGNNPWPLGNELDICCDDCNIKQVIPTRIALEAKRRDNGRKPR